MEFIFTNASARLLAKPFNDLYESAKSKIKNIGEKWSRISEIEFAYEKLSSVRFVNTITSHTPISLTEFYYPPKLKTGSFEKKISAESINDISKTKNILILGTAGQGKSTLLRSPNKKTHPPLFTMVEFR